MPRVLSSLLSVSLFLISVFSLGFAQTATTTPIAPISLPLVFEANRGQTAPQVQYVARSREGAMFFMNDGLIVAAPQLNKTPNWT
ncbi:MAG TPA: hypothetical protein VI685_20560 [Candidatus Angelobacter sp.]